MVLYHFTCNDGKTGILRDGLIRPGSDFGVELPQSMFVWFTDLDVAPREGLGLMSVIGNCDRLAHRFAVDSPKVMPWKSIRRTLPRYFVDALETTPGAMPMHWWVAAEPIEAIR